MYRARVPDAEQGPGDVVEPQALADVVELDRGVDAPLPLELQHLAESPQVAGLGARRGADEGGHHVGRHLGAHHPRAQGEDVDVVVLDHLVGGVVVGPVGGPHPRQPVGGDGDPGPAAAHQDPPLGLGRGQAVADQFGDHRVVDALGRGGVGTEQHRLVAGVGDRLRHPGPQRQAGVVGGDGDPHGRTPPHRTGDTERCQSPLCVTGSQGRPAPHRTGDTERRQAPLCVTGSSGCGRGRRRSRA